MLIKKTSFEEFSLSQDHSLLIIELNTIASVSIESGPQRKSGETLLAKLNSKLDNDIDIFSKQQRSIGI